MVLSPLEKIMRVMLMLMVTVTTVMVINIYLWAGEMAQQVRVAGNKSSLWTGVTHIPTNK